MSPELQQLLVAAAVVAAMAYLTWRRSAANGCGGCASKAPPAPPESHPEPLHEGLVQLDIPHRSENGSG